MESPFSPDLLQLCCCCNIIIQLIQIEKYVKSKNEKSFTTVLEKKHVNIKLKELSVHCNKNSII